MPMRVEPMKTIFDSLPNRVKAGLRSIGRESSPETEKWLTEPIPALDHKSIQRVISDFEDGESRVVAYCNSVKGRFFSFG
jgi:hypothetical protein